MKKRLSSLGVVKEVAIRGAIVPTVLILACAPVEQQVSGADGAAGAAATGATAPQQTPDRQDPRSTAERQATPTRERISLEGSWRWQAVEAASETVPAGGWSEVTVPGPWPGGSTASWYQRDMAIPVGWKGRHVELHAEFVNSFAGVYVDGRKAGIIRFPGGGLDLTALCTPGQTHELSIQGLAIPLKEVLTSFNDSDMSRKKRGSVGRKGLCGDIYLEGEPLHGRIDYVKIETSVRAWEITFDTDLGGIDPEARYAFRAVISDASGVVKELLSTPFSGSSVSDGRKAVTMSWKPDRLWDIHTPQNQYEVALSLLDGSGTVLDEALPERFGFREFWIDGRDFYLNGTRIFLSFDRSQPGWDYRGARQTLMDRKKIGINFCAAGGFGCEPGSHMSFEGCLRAADDVGTLMALTQPHSGHYEWNTPDAEQANGYAEHARFYRRVAGNHPSVVFYAGNHNACGYTEDMNPDLIDGLVDRSRWTRGTNVPNALRAEAIVERLDSSRVFYHHAAGNLGRLHTSNFYANWTPIQELSDWFEHWATVGVKPVHTNEYGCPYPWDWTMYRGWYKGVRTFGSAVVPWEFCMAEWNAQFYGDEAYKLDELQKGILRWEACMFSRGERWNRWDYPVGIDRIGQGVNAYFPDREGVYTMYITDNLRAFRTWGMSVNDPSDYARHASDALTRNNMPLLAYIGGKPEAFTSKDHNFVPGEAFQKQLIVINNSRETVTATCKWSLALPQPVSGSRTVTVPTGQQERIPLTFELPADLASGQYELSAGFAFSTGEAQDDSFTIDVMPAPQSVTVSGRVALFDPVGDTASVLGTLGIAFEKVEADADLAGYDVFVVGKGALDINGPAPDISRVREGLKVVICEQTGDVLEQRLGFRVARYGLRRVSPRVPDHPLLSGLSAAQLQNWRGSSTVHPPRITRDLNYSITTEWCGIRVPRGWRCGNRGNVASSLIEKPASGDFLTLLDGGYALQYAALMEYREGRGMVIFCQTDVSGRTEGDPAAAALARNIFAYVSSWKPAPQRRLMYAGDKRGLDHLKRAGFEVKEFAADALSADHVLVAAPGGGAQLAKARNAIADWYGRSGLVLVIGMQKEEVISFLPIWVAIRMREHIASHFAPPAHESVFCGIGPADIHNRDPRFFPKVVEGASFIAEGLLARSGDGKVVFCQMPPWEFGTAPMNQKRTFRRASYALTRVMGNMGLRSATPVLEHFSAGVRVPVDAQAQFRGTIRIESGSRVVKLPDNWQALPLVGIEAPEGWVTPDFDDSAWRRMRVPGSWGSQFKDLADFDGRLLYRAKVTVPAEVARDEAFLVLGAIDDEDRTFVNGTSVGSITKETNPRDYWQAVRRYRVPAGTLVTGVNLIAIEANDLRQAGGIMGFTSVREDDGLEAKRERRWLSGLYLDTPEEWDDPYRFFRW